MTSPDSKPPKGTDIYDVDPRRRVEAWMGLISDSSQGEVSDAPIALQNTFLHMIDSRHLR